MQKYRGGSLDVGTYSLENGTSLQQILEQQLSPLKKGRKQRGLLPANLMVVHLDNLQPGVLGRFLVQTINRDIDSAMQQIFVDSAWCCRWVVSTFSPSGAWASRCI